jgi:hypothetical protein
VFDNDGTLWCEKPMPIQLDFILRRMVGMAEQEPSLRSRQPWKAACERDFAWLGGMVVKHYHGDDSDVKLMMVALGQAFGGISVEDYESQGEHAEVEQHRRLSGLPRHDPDQHAESDQQRPEATGRTTPPPVQADGDRHRRQVAPIKRARDRPLEVVAVSASQIVSPTIGTTLMATAICAVVVRTRGTRHGSASRQALDPPSSATGDCLDGALVANGHRAPEWSQSDPLTPSPAHREQPVHVRRIFGKQQHGRVEPG